jgi:hypothetical protein
MRLPFIDSTSVSVVSSGESSVRVWTFAGGLVNSAIARATGGSVPQADDFCITIDPADAAKISSKLAGGIGRAAAQSAATDIAYVESVRGRIVASSRGNPTLLEALDTIADGTQLDLKTDSELQICHYRTGRMLTLRGRYAFRFPPPG